MSFYKKSSNVEGFTTAGGRLPGWLVGLSIFGTYLSSISFLALPGKAYGGNFVAFAFSLSLPFAAIIAVKWFAPLYRASGDVSAYAYLERRFGLWARLYATCFYLLTQLARVGTILFLVALALERLTGWNIETIIITAGIVTIIYTMTGGIEAVIWTDAIQSVILTLGAISSVGIIIWQIPGGFWALIETAGSAGKLSFGSMSPDFFTGGFWTLLIYGLFINLQNFGIDQSYVQRYQSAKSLDDAKKSVWIGALLYIPVSALFLFIGSALFAYYSVLPDLLPKELMQAGMGDRIFPYFIVTELPPGMTGLLIAALFSAAMSSVDSSLNSSATIVMTDIYKRLLRPSASDAELIIFLRRTTFVIGVAGIIAALCMISVKGTLDVWWKLAGIFSGGMVGLFILGAFSRKATGKEAMTGVIVGVVFLLWSTLSAGSGSAFAYPLSSFTITVFATTLIIVTGIIMSRRNKIRPATRPPETIHDLPTGDLPTNGDGS